MFLPKARTYIFMMRLIANNRKLITYGLIGLSAALVDVFFFFYFYKTLSFPSTLSTALSMFISMCYGFMMNIFFNFNVYDRLIPRFFSYAAVSFVGLVLSSGSLYLFTDTFGYDGGIVKIITLPFIFLTQYLLNTHFSFSKLFVVKKIDFLEKKLN